MISQVKRSAHAIVRKNGTIFVRLGQTLNFGIAIGSILYGIPETPSILMKQR